MAAEPDLHGALASRVLRRVARHGVPTWAVTNAVSRVLSELEARQAAAPPSFVAVVSARSLPDLASRLRQDLEREGFVIQEIGIGSAGAHTVVTLRLPEAARQPLERLAEQFRYSTSYLDGVA